MSTGEEELKSLVTAEELDYLKESRKYLRAKVTRKYNSINDNLQSFSRSERDGNVSDLKELRKKLQLTNERISRGLWAYEQDDSKLNSEFEACDEYDEKIAKTIRRLQSLFQHEASREVTHSSPEPTLKVSNQLKLPQIPLPEYSHSRGESLEKFLNGFESIMNKYSLSNYEKFVFLEKQLSKEPLILVRSLSGSQQSYEAAKDLLVKAFASPLTQKYDVIKQMAELKLPYQSDIYSFISEVRVITESFKSLKIDPEVILQYFIWNAMNDTLRTQFIHITNSNKPTLNEINEHMFEAAERYNAITKKYNKKSIPTKDSSSSTTGLAANIKLDTKSNFKKCIMCSNDKANNEHSISKCPIYKSSKSKFEKLRVMKACTKCTNFHKSAECHFKFYKPCIHCSKDHFSFLCMSSENKNKLHERKTVKENHSSSRVSSESNAAKDSTETTNSSTISVDSNVLNLNIGNSTILPTFTCSLPSGFKVRALKDSRCQSNFILESLARQEYLKVVRSKFQLTVNGFNSSRNYLTKIVECPIKFGTTVHKIQAVCVPEINTSLKINGLHKLARAFTSKNYSLADEYLLRNSDNINDIKLILGANSSYCIPERTVSFGTPTPSTYIDTPMGIMLIGTIQTISKNLPQLPHNNDETNINIKFSTDTSDMSSGLETYDSADDKPSDRKFYILDDEGKVVNSELQKALTEVNFENSLNYLNRQCSNVLNYETNSFNEEFVETNEKLAHYIINNTERDQEGRLIMPIMWNSRVSHLLASNLNLSRQILKSNLTKLQKSSKLSVVDDIFKEQESLGVIERIEDINVFAEKHPECSFMPHMPVFRPDKDTTKCRVVYLSNLSEKDASRPMTMSHNQAMLAGPCLNRKITTSLLQLRFDRFVICFDLVKAFLQIKLYPIDQVKLCFLWVRNARRGDLSIIGYKCTRVPFELRCSPALLMLGLYYILILNSEADSPQIRQLKNQIYDLMYMDNGAYSCNDHETLEWAFNQLENIFSPFKFGIQQLCTNNAPLQAVIDEKCGSNTQSSVKLLGLSWDRDEDSLSTQKLSLNLQASTKREILSSIASNFDLFNFNGPILNRARLFMHELQCSKDLGWDTRLTSDRLREWKNIANQVNVSPCITIKRFVGKRDDHYKLIAFVDSSKVVFGVTLFMLNLTTNKVSFLLSKNRIVNKQLENKSIPSLELQAISLGADTLIETYRELSGPSCVVPIQIDSLQLYSDSLVCLNWLHSYINEMGKMQKRSVFVMNRLAHISRTCEHHPIVFGFCAGVENPADHITRSLSYKQLMKSNYFSGPSIEFYSERRHDLPSIIIPNPLIDQVGIISHDETEQLSVAVDGDGNGNVEHLIQLDVCSRFQSLVSIHRYVLAFVNILKLKLRKRDPSKYSHLKIMSSDELLRAAHCQIIIRDQSLHFKDIINYFNLKDKRKRDMPNLVGQLNLFRDDLGLIRVKCKIKRWKDDNREYPILLSKDSILSEQIILDLHQNIHHGGCYSVLTELRKKFWITHSFTLVKKTIKKCVTCRRFNNRTIKLNQSSYRDFRIDPPNVPYRYIFLDHVGPYFIKSNGKKVKIYLLCITCLWSRAINLKLCQDLSTNCFLRALQLQIFEFGVPEICFSDLGSQIVAGANLVAGFLNDVQTQTFFSEQGIKPLKFEQYFKGNCKLGSLVESCVKLTKRLIHGAIKNSVLNYCDFEFLICQTIHLINRRPIAFKDGLRDNDAEDEIPEPITPEIILRGYELTSLNIIPDLHPVNSLDPTWYHEFDHTTNIRDNFFKLRKARERLSEIYHEEFISNLIHQATNTKDKYSHVAHRLIHIGDIVLLKEPFQKPSNFPMGIVKEVVSNDLGEVTGAIVLKGGSRERVKRHVSSIIPLLSRDEYDTKTALSEECDPVSTDNSVPESLSRASRPTKKAAIESRNKTSQLLTQNM